MRQPRPTEEPVPWPEELLLPERVTEELLLEELAMEELPLEERAMGEQGLVWVVEEDTTVEVVRRGLMEEGDTMGRDSLISLNY